MFKRLVMVVTTAMVLATGVAAAQAPTPQAGRKGFVIGVGAGFGYSTWNETTYDFSCVGYYCGYNEVRSGNRSGVFTSFKVGYAPSDRLMILWHSTGTFFGSRYGTGFITDGMGGLSIQYYFSSGPGAYALGGGGYHNVMRFDPESPYGGGVNSFGFGVRGGFGFEFHKHWSVEAIVQHGFNSSENNPTSFAATLNWMWY
jgi:hypothetical protein